MRILVTGSRDWPNPGLVWDALTKAIDCSPRLEPVTVVHGACPAGADKFAAEFCESETAHLENAGINLVEEPLPADWDHCAVDCPRKPHRVWKKPGDVDHPGARPDYCPKAGPRRNRHMVELGAEVCLAFISPCTKPSCWLPKPHGSHGASHAADLADRAGMVVRRYASGGEAR